MKDRILITYAKQYQIENGTTGTTVQYFFLDKTGSFLKVDESGQQNAKVSLSYDSRNKMNLIPGIYEGEFEMTIGSDRKPILKLVDVELIGSAIIKADPDSPFAKQHEAMAAADQDAKGKK